MTRWPGCSRMSSCRQLQPFPTCRPQYIIFIGFFFFFFPGRCRFLRSKCRLTGRRLKSPSSLLWTCSHPAPAATASAEKHSAQAGIFQKHSTGNNPWDRHIHPEGEEVQKGSSTQFPNKCEAGHRISPCEIGFSS